jgi:hypothetical protein
MNEPRSTRSASTAATSRARRPRARRWYVALGVLAALLLAELALTSLLHAVLFYPSSGDTRAVEAIDGTRVHYRTSDGVDLVRWFVPARGERRRTVVYFHGNAATAAGCWYWAEQLADRGADVLLAEYRGYGGSAGSPSARGVERDAEAAIRYLREVRHVPARELVVHGQSLGGAAAAVALSGPARDAAGGILESTFTSLHEMSRAVTGAPLTWLVYDAYALDIAERAPSIRTRVLHLHGDEDEVVPFALGEALQARLPRARFLRIHGGSHNVADPAARDAMLAFVEEVAP